MKLMPVSILIVGALAGCASLQPQQPTPNEVAAARNCKNQAPPTGSHLVDPRTCGTSGQAISVTGEQFGTAMRQAGVGSAPPQ